MYFDHYGFLWDMKRYFVIYWCKYSVKYVSKLHNLYCTWSSLLVCTLSRETRTCTWVKIESRELAVLANWSSEPTKFLSCESWSALLTKGRLAFWCPCYNCRFMSHPTYMYETTIWWASPACNGAFTIVSKCRASEEIRNLFYKYSHQKVLVRKHARSEAPLCERCAMICNRSGDILRPGGFVVQQKLIFTMKRQHRTSTQVIGRKHLR